MSGQSFTRQLEDLHKRHGFSDIEAAARAMLTLENMADMIPMDKLAFLAKIGTQLNRLERMKPSNAHEEELLKCAPGPYDPEHGANQELIQRANQIMNRRKR